MAIPKYDEMYNLFMDEVSDSKIHTIQEIRDSVSKKLKLTDKELSEVLNSGRNLYTNRIGWTATYLKKAGLINSDKRGEFYITDEGKKVVKSKAKINNDFLTKYKSFSDFKIRKTTTSDDDFFEHTEFTPQEAIEKSICEINSELEDVLLDEIKKKPFNFLEQLSVKLMVKMGYGKKELSSVTRPTNDGGIDGIVFQDELGINKILIQAKLFTKGEKVSRPEIQKFIGALRDNGAPSGVFITTSQFSSTAKECADRNNIVTIDGSDLVKLMIKYDVGCFTCNNYEIKKIDLDFFEDD